MAGYSGTPLIKKLGIKSGLKVLMVNEPAHYFEILGPLPGEVQQVSPGYSEPIDFIHVFCRDESSLNNELPPLKHKLDKNGMIWISWVKKASKNYEATISENEVRELGLSIGLVDVKVCAVDEDWSALKFVYHKEDR